MRPSARTTSGRAGVSSSKVALDWAAESTCCASPNRRAATNAIAAAMPSQSSAKATIQNVVAPVALIKAARCPLARVHRAKRPKKERAGSTWLPAHNFADFRPHALEVQARSNAVVAAEDSRIVSNSSARLTIWNGIGRLHIEDIVHIEKEAEAVIDVHAAAAVHNQERFNALELAEILRLVRELIHRTRVIEVGEQRDRTVEIIHRGDKRVLRIAERALIILLGRASIRNARKLQQVLVRAAQSQGAPAAQERCPHLVIERRDDAAVMQLGSVEKAGLDECELVAGRVASEQLAERIACRIRRVVARIHHL